MVTIVILNCGVGDSGGSGDGAVVTTVLVKLEVSDSDLDIISFNLSVWTVMICMAGESVCVCVVWLMCIASCPVN